MKNLLFIENGYARITPVDPDMGVLDEIETCLLRDDKYIRIDDGKQYPQLCKGAARRGNTLSWHGPKQLAYDCNARLYKTREGYDRAVRKAVEKYGKLDLDF